MEVIENHQQVVKRHESHYDSKRKRMMITRNRVCDDYRDDDDDDPIALISRFVVVWIRVCLLEVQWFLAYGRRPTSLHLYKFFLLRGVGLQARDWTNVSRLGALASKLARIG